MDWVKEIGVMALIKSEIAKHDSKKLWPYSLPRVAAKSQMLEDVEKHLGNTLDKSYAEFLQYADGWPAFCQYIDLFGTQELLGNERMQNALRMLASIEADVLSHSGFSANQLIPVAASSTDLDLFVLTSNQSRTPGVIVWFANNEIERFVSFEEFFLSMIDYNRRELSKIKGR